MSRTARLLLVIALLVSGCSLVGIARPGGPPEQGSGTGAPVVNPLPSPSPAA